MQSDGKCLHSMAYCTVPSIAPLLRQRAPNLKLRIFADWIVLGVQRGDRINQRYEVRLSLALST